MPDSEPTAPVTAPSAMGQSAMTSLRPSMDSMTISAVITVVLYVVGQNLGDASDPRTHM